MIWVLNQLVWFSLGSYRNDLERDRSTCYSHSLQWQFFGPCVQEVAHVCKSNTNIQCLHSPLRLLLKICNIQIWPLSCYFLQNLLMKTYFRGWLFNSQSTCFLTACHVLGAKKKNKTKSGEWGLFGVTFLPLAPGGNLGLWRHWFLPLWFPSFAKSGRVFWQDQPGLFSNVFMALWGEQGQQRQREWKEITRAK